MFKHILVPTDGSGRSESAVRKGIDLAKSVGAKVTGLYVIPDFHIFTYRTEMLEDTREQYAKDCEAHAAQYLGLINKVAKDAGVPCNTVHVSHDHPYEAILRTAEQLGCDLIVMASHGRRGVQGVLLGSETQKVLTHAHIPVLVSH